MPTISWLRGAARHASTLSVVAVEQFATRVSTSEDHVCIAVTSTGAHVWRAHATLLWRNEPCFDAVSPSIFNARLNSARNALHRPCGVGHHHGFRTAAQTQLCEQRLAFEPQHVARVRNNGGDKPGELGGRTREAAAALSLCASPGPPLPASSQPWRARARRSRRRPDGAQARPPRIAAHLSPPR